MTATVEVGMGDSARNEEAPRPVSLEPYTMAVGTWRGWTR